MHVFLDGCSEWYFSVAFLTGQVLGNWYLEGRWPDKGKCPCLVMGRYASGEASLDNGQEEGHALGDACYGPCLLTGTSWSRDPLGFQFTLNKCLAS